MNILFIAAPIAIWFTEDQDEHMALNLAAWVFFMVYVLMWLASY